MSGNTTPRDALARRLERAVEEIIDDLPARPPARPAAPAGAMVEPICVKGPPAIIPVRVIRTALIF